MQNLQLLLVKHISVLTNPRYYKLLFPDPKNWLSKCNDELALFGLILLERETVIGGIFGTHDKARHKFQIRSWMVRDELRGLGFGQGLLRALKMQLAQYNIQQIELAYSDEGVDKALIQHILNK